MRGAGNAGGSGGNGAPPEIDFPAYDRLAPDLRRMVQNFALPLSAAAVEQQARRFDSPAAFEAMNRVVLQKFRDAKIAAMWSHDHPMIGQPLRENWT